MRRAAATAAALLLGACAQAPLQRPMPASVEALAQAMGREPIVVVGEVHDNRELHALRAQALRLLLERGARPALAFEQFDRESQPLLDQVRAQAGGDSASRAARLIEAAGARGWNWDLYRPYLVLALEKDLPIVAANLSRKQAMKIAQDGIGAVFDAREQAGLGLAAVGSDIERAQEGEIEAGHCGRIPREAVPAMARAQIARDAVLARSLSAYAQRGVILLTGNGHARRDIGVLRYLSAADRARAISIGLLEDDERAAAMADHFDVVFLTPVQTRKDPCADFPQIRKGIGEPAAQATEKPGGDAPRLTPRLTPASMRSEGNPDPL